MNFAVGASLPLVLPVPDGWSVDHDVDVRRIRLQGPTHAVTFSYDLYAGNGRETGVYLKDDVLVQCKGYGGRWTARRALEYLCTRRFG